MMDQYTWEFKAEVEVFKTVGSGIQLYAATMKLVCKDEDENYKALSTRTLSKKQERFKKMHVLGKDMCLTALYLDGLNHKRYNALQKQVHKG